MTRMLDWFKRKKKVSLLNENWEVLESVVKVVEIPRQGDYIFIDKYGYLKVVIVVHNILKKQGIFLVVEKINNNLEK